MNFRLVIVGSLFMAVVIVGCDQIKTTTYFEQGAVASVSPLASAVGADVFAAGGNAVDAAVAVAFTLAVVHPQAGNIGGGGFALVRDAKTGAVEALDFRETAPAAATPDMFLDDSGLVMSGLSTQSALASGVPGSVAGLHALWVKYGSLPWTDLVAPAAGLADSGFVVGKNLAEDFEAHASALLRFDDTKKLFAPSGRMPGEGERFTQPTLAATLYLIAAEGPEAFYQGSIADSIVASMEIHDGLITRSDLASYRAVWRQPIHFRFDSLDIYSMPPPSSGGVVLGQILGLVEPFDFSRYGSTSPEVIHPMVEAARLAYADRSVHLGDPDFWAVPSELLRASYLDQRRSLMPVDQAGKSAETAAGVFGHTESDETTHFSICDRDGNMVAITTTINSAFGSGLAVGGAGFLLNNEMDDFAIKPGHQNIWGLVGGDANKIEPGKRMLSSMTPTLVLKDGHPYLALGSPGGAKIITTVAQAILAMTRFDLSPAETVALPRYHHQWLPDLLYLEAGAFDQPTKDALTALGYQIKERTAYGDVQIIEVIPTGLMSAASDPRRGGAVAGH